MTIKDSPEEWEIRATETPFVGNKTSVRTDDVVMPDGHVARRDYQVHPGSVAVLALDGTGRVLVIRQYRHPVRHKLWEIPAGLLDVPGENPLHAAQRELYEEAHVKAEDWRVLTDVYTTPGGCDEAVRIFLARDLSEAEGERFEVEHEEADMELARVPLDVLVRGVLAGELHNNCLVVGVLSLIAAQNGDGLDALRQAEAPWPARPFES
ncbi:MULTISPECIES: NUDIX domain-containing protein [unclassified Streptomyces]|uniref:NUDIX domain-containing protein n=1 Tax=unclassified Streptomyces TaxID=2593676 RepID=UPI00225C2CC7|nr:MULTISPECIES: NUDIX hydrolase [unclassified Streptomyces]MCX5058147.1 NUDIX hydrolase [Streptomyces sp. NBC_00452]MCX5244973.1 NUDIX hydrolase [Streptomyces sp. NBC_00201]MCX5289295.1 NUDIX hydrolase [Streptomyces sp. NBC_00183]